jgi:hypothetical protein
MKNRKKILRPRLGESQKSKRFLFFAGMVFLFSIFTTSVFAGSVNGPYVIWVNLDSSNDAKRVDKIVGDFASKKSTECNGNWATHKPLLYMKRRPPLITDKLIRRVFLEGNLSQKIKLNQLLRSYTDVDLDDGFDGVIVHAKIKGESQILSLTTGKNKIQSYTAALKNSLPQRESIEDAFCALIPPITRKP